MDACRWVWAEPCVGSRHWVVFSENVDQNISLCEEMKRSQTCSTPVAVTTRCVHLKVLHTVRITPCYLGVPPFKYASSLSRNSERSVASFVQWTLHICTVVSLTSTVTERILPLWSVRIEFWSILPWKDSGKRVPAPQLWQFPKDQKCQVFHSLVMMSVSCLQ